MRDNLSQRPKIDVPKTHWDYVADALAIVGIFLSLLILFVTWTALPEQVPRAILASGEPIAWGDRWTATLPLGMAVVNYVILRLMARVPHYFNYPWPITRENAAIQYRLSRSMVLWLNAIVVWMLLIIAWSQTRVALGAADRFPAMLILGFLVLIHVVLGVFIYRAYQHRHGDSCERRRYSNQS